MSTVDVNRVILTGENSVIRLTNNDSDNFTTNATFWRILSSAGGPGNVLYLKSELTEARWRIYSDNIAMARWLQSTVLGAINTELRDLTIAVTDARFEKSGDVRDFWTERLNTRDEEIVLTWYQLGEPFLVHTQPNTIPGRPYGMCTVLDSGSRRAADPQWNGGQRSAVAEGPRRSTLQHMRTGIVRELDPAEIGSLPLVSISQPPAAEPASLTSSSRPASMSSSQPKAFV